MGAVWNWNNMDQRALKAGSLVVYAFREGRLLVFPIVTGLCPARSANGRITMYAATPCTIPLNYSLLCCSYTFGTGNSSRRSSNPFFSDMDRSWLDMVYALLVPGRVNISNSETLDYPPFGLVVFGSYTINGGLPDICGNVSNSMLLLLLSLLKSSDLVRGHPHFHDFKKDPIHEILPFKWCSLLLVPVPNSSPGSSKCIALSLLRGCNIQLLAAHDPVTTQDL